MTKLIWGKQDGGMLGYLLYDENTNIVAGCEPDCGNWSWYLPDWTGIHGRDKTLEETVNAIEGHIIQINPGATFDRRDIVFLIRN